MFDCIGEFSRPQERIEKSAFFVVYYFERRRYNILIINIIIIFKKYFFMSKHLHFHEIEAGADNSRAMEPETIQKNGASPKSHTSRGNFLIKACFVVLLAGITLLFINSCTSISAQSSGSKSERWEYKVYYYRVYSSLSDENMRKELNVKLNEFGAESWELVSSGTSNAGSLDYFIFKRRLP